MQSQVWYNNGAMITLRQFEDALRGGEYRTPDDALRTPPLPRGFRAWWRFFGIGIGKTLLSDLSGSLKKGFSQATFSEMSLRTIQAIESTGAPVTVEGGARIAALGGRPCVFAANHMSLVETVNLPCILGTFGPVAIVAKRSLSRYPLFGACLKAVNPILLDRKNVRHDLSETLSQGKARLAEGRSVLLFPQGTRLAVFDPRKFNSLGAKLAREAGVPLVPVACKTDYAELGRLLKDFGPIDPSRPVKYALGPALDPALPQAELMARCTEFIVERLTSWGCPCAK